MRGEKDKSEPAKFKVWCSNFQCAEENIEYFADAVAYTLTPVEKA